MNRDSEKDPIRNLENKKIQYIKINSVESITNRLEHTEDRYSGLKDKV